MSSSATPTTVRATNGTASNLKPKEHGAYAILAVPIVTALLIAGPTLPGVCIAIAAVAGFLAHEPLLIAWGHRGSRAQRTIPEASRRLITMASITVVCGLLACLVGAADVRISLVVCLILAVTSFAVALLGKHRTLGAQVWGVVGLSAPCVPILLAGARPTMQALSIWLVWLVGFASTTIAVRGVIAAQKRRTRMIHWTLITTLCILTSMLFILEHPFVCTVLPMLIMSWYLMIQPPPAKHLRRVGWSLVAGTIATAIWLTWLAR